MSDAKSQDSQAPRESSEMRWPGDYGGLNPSVTMLLIVALHPACLGASYRLLAAAAQALCFLAFSLDEEHFSGPLMALRVGSKIRQGEFGRGFSDTRSRARGDLSQNVDRL